MYEKILLKELTSEELKPINDSNLFYEGEAIPVRLVLYKNSIYAVIEKEDED